MPSNTSVKRPKRTRRDKGLSARQWRFVESYVRRHSHDLGMFESPEALYEHATRLDGYGLPAEGMKSTWLRMEHLKAMVELRGVNWPWQQEENQDHRASSLATV